MDDAAFSLHLYHLRAYGADDDGAPPRFSILFSTGVTLAERYWVTTDERRRLELSW